MIAGGIARLRQCIGPWPCDPIFIGIVAVGTMLAAHAAAVQSITFDEAHHVVAGVAYWQHAAYEVYPHNPPFVKYCQSLPVVLSGATIERDELGTEDLRPFALTQRFGRRNEARLDALYFRARLVSVFFYVCGAILIGHWSAALFGPMAGRISTALWCFHPLVLAHSAVATPDIGSTVIGLLTIRLFAWHLKTPGLHTALLVGVFLGLAQLSKFTLVMLYPTGLTVWLMLRCLEVVPLARLCRELRLLIVTCVVSALVLVAGYGCHGMGVKVGDLTFSSPTFRAGQSAIKETPFRYVTIVIPKAYLLGFDQQALDVEGAYPTYFSGQESQHGWLTYYPTAVALKTPIAFWIVIVLAIVAALRNRGCGLSDELSLASVPILLGGFLWANPSLTYLRYLLPVYPFVFVSLGRVGEKYKATNHSRLHGLKRVVLLATLLPPLCHHPHYLGYFDDLFGGARRCWPLFTDSEIDWGQDLQKLQTWQTDHPEANPIRHALFAPFHSTHGSGTRSDEQVPKSKTIVSLPDNEFAPSLPQEPFVGFLAISVTILNRFSADRPRSLPMAYGDERRFLRWVKSRQTPIAMVGTSILIYRFDEGDLARWRSWAEQNAVGESAVGSRE